MLRFTGKAAAGVPARLCARAELVQLPDPGGLPGPAGGDQPRCAPCPAVLTFGRDSPWGRPVAFVPGRVGLGSGWPVCQAHSSAVPVWSAAVGRAEAGGLLVDTEACAFLFSKARRGHV